MSKVMLKFWILTGIFSLGLLSSCKDKTKTYEIPTDYTSIKNVSYQGQTDRLGMLGELKSYIASATSGTTLDIAKMNAMYSNTSSTVWANTYPSGKQLRSKTKESEREMFDKFLEDAADDSGTTETATNGTAGVLVSLDGAKKYFVNKRGVEYAQIVEKGLMGALIMYQQTGVYLEPSKMDVDNKEVTEGKGTKMEHHWDESFGYYGVPKDFPTNTSGIVFWGKYGNSRDSKLNINDEVMGAYLKGRAAISNKDLDTRDKQIDIIQGKMGEVAAGTAIHYINSAITHYNDAAKKCHALSEAVAFAYSLKFNPDSKATTAQVNEVLTLLGGDDDFKDMNFWNTTQANLEAAREKMRGHYGWDKALAESL